MVIDKDQFFLEKTSMSHDEHYLHNHVKALNQSIKRHGERTAATWRGECSTPPGNCNSNLWYFTTSMTYNCDWLV
jgi:hypothetical protein